MIKLYSHQEEALDKLKNGNILQGGTGSGKSLTALIYYYQKVLEGNILTEELSLPKKHIDLYIITTAKKRDSLEWEDDLLKICLYPDKDHYNDYNDVNIFIDSWNNIKKYITVKDAFFIFDEQKVTSFGTWSKSFIKISRNNQWILLTATPGDSWLQYLSVFIANGFYANKKEFERKHIVYNTYVTKYPCIDYYVNVSKLIEYRDQITVQMKFVRGTNQIHKYVKVSYDQDLYFKTMKNRWDYINDCPFENISALCSSLRKITNTDPSRIDAVANILKEHRKAIIFYSFDYELYLLRDLLSSTGYLWKEWNGHKHEEVPKGDHWVYLINYSSGAEAWNCITTDTIIFYSQTYSYKTLVQATGRIDRLNTPYVNLYYYHIISDSKIDRAIANTLNNKKKFNELDFISKF